MACDGQQPKVNAHNAAQEFEHQIRSYEDQVLVNYTTMSLQQVLHSLAYHITTLQAKYALRVTRGS